MTKKIKMWVAIDGKTKELYFSDDGKPTIYKTREFLRRDTSGFKAVKCEVRYKI